jgi:hypothetical protein
LIDAVQGKENEHLLVAPAAAADVSKSLFGRLILSNTMLPLGEGDSGREGFLTCKTGPRRSPLITSGK